MKSSIRRRILLRSKARSTLLESVDVSMILDNWESYELFSTSTELSSLVFASKKV